MLTRKAWRDIAVYKKLTPGLFTAIWNLAHCLPDPREVPHDNVGISGLPCYTPCNELPKSFILVLDCIVMLGSSSFLGRIHVRGEWFEM